MESLVTAAPEARTSPPAVSGNRLAFIDWTRGVAALIMLQGHVFHSFAHKDLRQGDAFVLSQFIGGLPPAIFLFLAGLTLAFLMSSRERQGESAGQRVLSSLRRAGFLFAIAIVFRLQMWLFSWPSSEWNQLFKVDILNSMGFGIAVLSIMAAFPALERLRLTAILGVVIAAASPIVAMLDLSALHPFLRSYIVPHVENFAFFPWAAFLAFGISAGTAIRLVKPGDLKQAVQWGAWVGLALVMAGQYFSTIPYSVYARSDFWVNSPGLIFIKLGVILMLMSFAYLWVTYASPGWSWITQLGTTSLLVYWVHTELVYGRWFGGWKESLNTPHTVAASAAVIVLMVGVSMIQTNWSTIVSWFNSLRADREPEPARNFD